MLLAIMAQFLKMEALIPLHALIQLSSNVTRTWILRKYIDWIISRESLIGAALGGIVGYFYLVPISENWFNLLIGSFIILITLLPKFRLSFHFHGKWVLIGFVSCSIALFVGAIGTFIGAILLGENLEKKSMISTQSALQIIIHLAKIIIFSLLGFSLTPWILLAGGAVICAYLGAIAGTKILHLIPEKTFRIIMTWVVLLLAARLVVIGVEGFYDF